MLTKQWNHTERVWYLSLLVFLDNSFKFKSHIFAMVSWFNAKSYEL